MREMDNACCGCVYENIDDTTEDIAKCVSYKRNVEYAKNDYYMRKEDEGKMKEVTEILRLLVKAIEQSTVNTYQEQGSAAADVVFCILEDAEKRIDTLDRKTEKGGKQE